MRIAPAVVLLASALVSTAVAQVPPAVRPEIGPLVLQLPASTRALALGGAYPIASPDPDAIFYNPALLQSANGYSLAAQFYGSSARAFAISAANATGFGVGVQVLDYELPVSADDDDIGAPLGLSGDGAAAAGEALLSFGYTRMFFGKVRLGAAAKLATHWADDRRANSYALDLGSTINARSWLLVGVSIQNVGPSFDFGSARYDLPMRAAVYAVQRARPVGPLDISAVARVSGGIDEDPEGSLGVEVGYWPFTGLNFYGRAAGRYSGVEYRYRPNLIVAPTIVEPLPFTLGGGVSYKRFSLDYALEPLRRAADAHRLGIRVR